MTSSQCNEIPLESQIDKQDEDPYEMYDIPYTIDEEAEEKYYNTIFQDVKDDNGTKFPPFDLSNDEPTKEEIEEMCKDYDEFVREEYEDELDEPIDEDEELRKIYSIFSKEELLAELDEVEDERVRYFIYEALYNLEQR